MKIRLYLIVYNILLKTISNGVALSRVYSPAKNSTVELRPPLLSWSKNDHGRFVNHGHNVYHPTMSITPQCLSPHNVYYRTMSTCSKLAGP